MNNDIFQNLINIGFITILGCLGISGFIIFHYIKNIMHKLDTIDEYENVAKNLDKLSGKMEAMMESFNKIMNTQKIDSVLNRNNFTMLSDRIDKLEEIKCQ